MEAKKSPKADLTRWHGVLFRVNLLFTLSLLVVAFEWKPSDKQTKITLTRSTNIFEPQAEIPPTEIKSPPPPVIQQPTLIVVPDAEEIKQELKFDLDAEITTDTKVQEYTPVELSKIEEEVDKVFLVVEQTATPKDGLPAFYK